jgi:hypothetical protein
MTKPRSRTVAAPTAESTAAPINSPETTSATTPAPSPAAAAPERRPRKREIVLALLTRPEGASTAELMAATGWQAHTVRAALSTLRKDGEVITRTGRGETMRYVARDPR